MKKSITFPLSPLGYVCDTKLGKMLQTTPRTSRDLEVPYLRAGLLDELSDIADFPTMFAGPREVKDYCIREGDLLIAEGGDVGRAEFAPQLMVGTIFQNSLHRIRLRSNGDLRFVRYALTHIYGSGFLEVLCNKTTFGHLTVEKLRDLRIPWPQPGEQTAIADYLDLETARIDATLSKKRRLIDLLNSRLIGLAEDFSTAGGGARDTGIPSMPSVPSSWRVLRNKIFMRGSDDRTADGSGEMLSVSHITGVTPRSEKTVYMFEAESTEGYKIVCPGDLVINTMWAWMGAAGVAKTEGIVSPAYGVYHIDPNIMLPEFFDILIRTPAYITEMTRFSRGVTSSRLRLYPDEFLRLSSPVPPIATQREIVDSFRVQSSATQQVCDLLARRIDLLDERRQALITAVVTGEMAVPSPDT